MGKKTMKGLLCAAAILALALPAVADDAGPAPQRPRGGSVRLDRNAPFPFQGGEAIYKGVCQGCHMPDAKGARGAGAYPALAGDKNLAEATYPALVIMTGQKAMPSFSDLKDDQIAAVVNYVRSNFGNRFKGTLTADQVKGLRAAAVHQDALAPG